MERIFQSGAAYSLGFPISSPRPGVPELHHQCRGRAPCQAARRQALGESVVAAGAHSGGGWRQTTFTAYGELVIPAALVSGSGFYSFVDENNVNDTSILGTLSLVVRECPAHRYGDGCRGWCPDCMHGGVCHPQTGLCVCREGTMGHRCETRCERGMGGRLCSVRSLTIPGKQLCQPSPIPCRCVPGYTGARCDISCTAEKWGSNCEQDCTHHCAGDCDSETGMCGGEGPSQCAGGDAGLPRLRQAPEVTDIGEDQATVVFSEWREGYDDGNATLWDTLTYVVRLTSNTVNNTAVDTIATGSRHTLTNLTPFTMYRVTVMVMVTRHNLTCMADGRGRERVHSVSFTTTCPEEIPAPVIVQTAKTSDTSVFVKWKPVRRPPGCDVQYLLSVIPETSNGTSTPLDTQNITLTETHKEVQELKANVAYTIQVMAKSKTSSLSVSASSSTRLKIHPRSVGHAKTVGVVVAVLVVAAVVVVVVLWRRRRRPYSSESVSSPPEEVSSSPPQPQPQPTTTTTTYILSCRMVEIEGKEEDEESGKEGEPEGKEEKEEEKEEEEGGGGGGEQEEQEEQE
ncbi:uncharacterized protein LOC123510946 isoform X2 [Portunus trituberculatus]|uniref:uncharacterized protein LOC123510946 isoform X2 n=1 Tax=Portunus trituberculatus TaxID=210409 RepID=UPI001E1CD013|nr:uncharacterized protein LOC123510946 isoform X2 [Portunus trituberculatus]